MFSIYVIQLPWNWSPRILAFSTKKKADEVCEVLNREFTRGGATDDYLSVVEMSVCEDDDIKVYVDKEH